MKILYVIGSLILSGAPALAGREEASELVSSLETAVASSARGDVANAVRVIDAEAPKPKNLKEVNSQVDELKTMYQKLAALGELDAVERLSLVYTGESFFRLRVVEKRSEGVVLWTFVGYRWRGSWYCKGMNLSANSDLVQLMHQELDAADAKNPSGETKS